MAGTIEGKTIVGGVRGNAPHKFVWYNLERDDFESRVRGLRVGHAHVEGRWLFVPLEPGHMLLLGEWGGRILYHAAPASPPAKHHLYLAFEDGSALSATTQVWGGVGLFEHGREREWQYVKNMRITPVEAAFTAEYFAALVVEVRAAGKRSVKGLLTQDQLIPGLGNAIAQDIMFRAGLHPRREIGELVESQVKTLYDEIVATVRDVTAAGGRDDERDLFGQPGGYRRIMSARTAGHPCPRCGVRIEKMQYLGGTCYVCPACQS
jgi:formamidopyrimidine-DNA glycosylase